MSLPWSGELAETSGPFTQPGVGAPASPAVSTMDTAGDAVASGIGEGLGSGTVAVIDL